MAITKTFSHEQELKYKIDDILYELLLSFRAEFPTSKLEMTAVADIFDRDGDGYIDYYEFVAALHPNKDAYRPTTDADKIEDEVRDNGGKSKDKCTELNCSHKQTKMKS